MEIHWDKIELLYINGEPLMKIGTNSWEKSVALTFIEAIFGHVMHLLIYFSSKDSHIYRGTGRWNSE